jgi:hypothetical protein
MCKTMLTFVQFTKLFLLVPKDYIGWLMFGRYQTIGESLQKNSQDIILTLNTYVSIVNVVVTNIKVNNEPRRSIGAFSTSIINFY